ncbi:MULTISPECIES: hypothetical protein [unclassified Pseudomonas]|uniref:hypothetical protein n=1 Tax=unclassified Pseudomonas TaxID=196821 RepID=UPI002AC8D5DD|nr:MULTISPECIES: hypothetical protein [unclassified Pseudomonas]MEB0048637.1 hypothetical protein [Pseudomonas sp. Dout3]MEB0099524.1 hypothetical protein [Pseudomonas sp. DC1.2]WPX60844.1 hypothetical protein RHM68_09480 [Pseudomonas sp. DC1.2]
MSLTMTIVLLICGWLTVAAAMLWGVLRISRRHYHSPAQSMPASQTDTPAAHRATAH